MKTESLAQARTGDTALQQQLATPHAVPRIDNTEASDPDHRRSMQQELASIESAAIGDFHGQKQLSAQAHALAGQIAELDGKLGQLIQAPAAAQRLLGIDQEA